MRLAVRHFGMGRRWALLLLPLLLLQVAAQRRRDGCSPGWERCPGQGLCVPSGCRDESSLDRAVPCGDTMVFCPRAAACITHCNNGAWDHPSNAQQPGPCGPGQGFCPSSGRCVSALECPEKDEGKTLCPAGTHFCPAQGGCVLGQCEHSGHGQQEQRDARTGSALKCPPGTAFCMSRGVCTEPGQCDAKSDTSSKPRRLTNSCGPGQVFCLEKGHCVAAGECDEPDGSGDLRASASGCPVGQVFCASLGTCVSDGQCGDGGREVCGAEQEFCLSSQRCEAQGRCGGQAGVGVQCQPNTMYCMATGRCELMQVGCGGIRFPLPNPPMSGVFPGVFPGGSNSPGVQPGSGGPVSPGGPPLPPGGPPLPGAEAVENMCRPFSDHCPTEPKCANFCKETTTDPTSSCASLNSSTCLLDEHCPNDQSCCTHPDTGFKRCSGSSRSMNEDALEFMCSGLQEAAQNTGLVCTLPSDCPRDSVCCNGVCKSPAGAMECPSSTLYCSVTNKCQRVGERCSRACGPGTVYCIANDDCTAKDDCEFGAYTSGSPWMMPGLIYMDKDEVSESPMATLAQLLGDGLTVEQLAMPIYVKGSSGEPGVWQAQQDDTWVAMKDNIVFDLSMKKNFRFVPSSLDRKFSYAVLSLVDPNGIERYVVQLIAPAPYPLPTSITNPYVEVLEDEITVLPVSDFVGVTAPLEDYMAPWANARRVRLMLQKPQQLLAFTHPTVETFLTMLDNATFAFTDHPVTALAPVSALRLQLEDSSSPIVMLAFSTGDDDKWTQIPPSSVLQVPLGSPSDLTKVKLRMVPYPDVSGRTSLTVVSGQFDNAGTVSVLSADALRGPRSYFLYQRGRNITIEVQGSNDAPVSRDSVNLSAIPTLTEQTKTKGFFATNLSSLFYTDSDKGDGLGLVVLYAQRSELGAWQYSADSGVTWTAITDLEEMPIKDPVLTGGYQGLVDLKKTLSGPECNLDEAIRTGQDLTTILQNEECINMIKQEAQQSTQAAMMGNKDQVLLQILQELALRQLQATYSETSDGQLQLNQGFPKMQAVFLPPLAMLRYLPASNITEPWDKTAAATKTRLMFTAWDRSDSDNFAPDSRNLPVENRTVQLFNCPLCGGGSSGALVPAIVVAEWAGCGGVVIDSDTPTEVDACGRCGGDNSTCIDCNGEIGGDAELVCGICAGGGTGVDRSTLRNCAGQCLTPGMSAGDVDCTLSIQNAVMCDGQIGSTATINECGYCVLGNTSLPEKEGLDLCGVCDGKNECMGCDEEIDSGKMWDLCGACLSPDDANFNDCEAVGDLKPSLLDVALTASSEGEEGGSVKLKAMVAGLNKTTHTLVDCSLVTADSQTDTIVATKKVFRDQTIVLGFSYLQEGSWQLLCEFAARARVNATGDQPAPGPALPAPSPDNRSRRLTSATVKIQSNASVIITDSTKLKLSVVSGTTIDLDQTSEIVVKVEGSGLSGNSRCYAAFGDEGTKPELAMALVVSSVSTTSGEVTCALKPNMPVGAARVGIVLVPSLITRVRNGQVNLPTATINFEGKPPTATNATLSADGRKLVIIFDTNIQVNGDCLNVFNSALFGSRASCKVRGDRIIYKLGADHQVKAGISLALTSADGGVTRQSMGGATPTPASGDVTVTQPVVKEDSLDFELIGDRQACNGTSVHIRVKPDRYTFFDYASIYWNITFMESSTTNQKYTLDTWDSVRKLREDMKSEITNEGEEITLPGNKFLPGLEYLITAQVEMDDGSRVGEPKGMTVKQLPADNTYHVSIRGPTSIAADREYQYRAEVSSCEEEGAKPSLPKLKYTWSIDGITAVFAGYEGDSVTLPKNFLMGGQAHVISASVMEDGVPSRTGKGMLLLQVQSRGIKAAVSTSSLKTGTANVIRLSAALSKDLDNLPGKLRYQWACKTSAGAGCYVGGTSGVMELLEVRLKQEVTAPTLIIPAALLQPGMYELTVTVSKGNRSAEAKVALELQQGTMPEVQLAQSELLVDPNKKVVVKASFTSEEMAEVQWQPVLEAGYSTVDIIDFSTPTTFDQASKRRPFPLVIPPADASKGWPGLQDDAVYKFQLLVTEGDKSGSADVIIKTNSPPSGGNILVSPSSGQALVTKFQFTANGWTDEPEDYPLSVTFGYSIPGRSNGEVSWLSPINGDVFNRSISVTAGGGSETQVTPWVRVCDSHGLCADASTSALSVTLPDSLPPEVFTELSSEISQAMSSDASVEAALTRAGSVLATLAAMGDTNNLAAMQAVVEGNAKNKITSLETNLQSEAAQSAAFGMMSGSLALMSDVDLSMDLLLRVQALNDKLLSQLSGLPPPDSSGDQFMYDSMNTAAVSSSSSSRPIYYPETDKDLNAVRNGGTRGGAAANQRSRRRKRDTEKKSKPSYSPMARSMVAVSIMFTEMTITKLNVSEGAKTAATDKLVSDMQTYAAGLCLSAEFGETLTVAERLVGLTVRKSQLHTETDETLAMVLDANNTRSFISRPNYVVWGPVIEQYRQWQCGKEDPETGDEVDCYGACLATMHYQKNISSPRMLQWASIGRGLQLRGEMVRSAILNPESGVETEVTPVTTASEYSIRLNNTSINEGREFRCMFWNKTEPKWQSKGCKTLSIVTDRGYSYQHCQCAVPGYLGVFSVAKSSGGNSTDDSTVITRSYKTVKFIIYENYTETVGDRKEEFEDYLTTQTAEKLQVMRDQIHNLTVSPGSILVEFQLMEETGSVRSSGMEDVDILYDQLQELINSGQLSFSGFTSEPLKVPPQNLDGSGSTNRAETNRTPIIIAGVCAGVVVIVLVALAVAIFVKQKKQRDKVSPIQSAPIGSLPPSYRSIHFEQSLDGTAGSMSKQNPQYADLDTTGTYTGDGLYIEHRGKSSASSTRSSGLGSSVGSGGLGAINDDEDAPVPAPFRYKSPTKSELNRSGPIPPHILEKMKEAEKELPTPGSESLSPAHSGRNKPNSD